MGILTFIFGLMKAIAEVAEAVKIYCTTKKWLHKTECPPAAKKRKKKAPRRKAYHDDWRDRY